MTPRLSALAPVVALLFGGALGAGAQTQNPDTDALEAHQTTNETVTSRTDNVITATAWDGRVLVPLRDVTEELGGHVRWNASRRTVMAFRNGATAEVKVGSKLAYVNGRPYRLAMAPTTVSGSMMVPVDLIHEAFGVVVGWNASTHSVVVMNPGSTPTTVVRRTNGPVTASVNSNADGGVRFSQNLPAVRENAGQNPAFEEYMRGRDFTSNQSDRQYLQFLESQDFKRYRANKPDWINDYTNFRSGLSNATLANEVSVPGARGLSAYDRYLVWRDFNAFTDNRPMWQANQAEFLNWRRGMDGNRGSAAWSTYLQDRRDMIANVERAYQNTRGGGATGRVGVTGGASAGGNAGPNK